MSFNRISAAVAVAVLVVSAVPAVALDRHVKIVNKTDFSIVEFYASSVGQDNWEENILGNDEVPPGGNVNVNIDDGTGYCKYDLKVVFSDGDEVVKNAMNVCEVGTFTIN
ncbi:hypothetical protein [Oharaeibacter diazotrophicus]|uniref:Uncharacterized protein n=1 Tax=Oharaeibacter diazotrophicus TaxID=1920512 RepID=A0A4R6R985_9HYPH|nr:hypothetical protein [Oharaeibacter diazotrophicus]TDP82620.1 hypothetical protein EDD54_3889 [Oharaeibacter diazotrophicus]BBE72616.1 hypothetical protein OHA_1_02214 [Pleomorphomonas sp. SM30]GLS76650.1 hypothetical protein GCM10007904_19870 [Oharaeibacter diazotrophicus]